MSQVRRIYVEKKTPFAVRAKELKSELRDYLGLTGLSEVRVFVRYDAEGISEETYRKALVTVFSEPPIDDVYEEKLPLAEGDRVFSVEYLPGQFDQRADSAEQCVKLLNDAEEPITNFNDNSTVLMLTCRGTRVLLPGFPKTLRFSTASPR